MDWHTDWLLSRLESYLLTFSCFDVNKSDIKERSAPSECLLHARPDDFTLHLLWCCYSVFDKLIEYLQDIMMLLIIKIHFKLVSHKPDQHNFYIFSGKRTKIPFSERKRKTSLIWFVVLVHHVWFITNTEHDVDTDLRKVTTARSWHWLSTVHCTLTVQHCCTHTW